MSDEIKEILKYFEDYAKTVEKNNANPMFINSKQMKILLDYITNLQESEAYYYGYYKDYKSRNEKASEYIDNNSHYYSTDTHEEGFVIDTEDEEFCNSLLNILQGSDKE